MKRSYYRVQLRFVYSGLLPIFAIFVVLRVWPIMQAFYYGFTDFKIAKRSYNFIGLQNYVNLIFRDRDFLLALKNTLLFALLTTVFSLLLALTIALIMDRRRILGIGFLHSLFFLPVVVSVVPSAIIWKWIYDPQFGILNHVLSLVGLPSVGWLVDKNFSLYSIVIFVIWKWLGYYLVIFWVGLKAIPNQYVEAAKIDGASELNVIWLIILPLLRPIMLLSTVFATVNGFTIFSEVYVMTVGSQGAPGNMVKVLTYDIYERGFAFFKIGQASAEAVILFVLLLGFTMVQFMLNRRRKITR